MYQELLRASNVGMCDIAVYIKQETNVRIEIESSCEKLYTCANTGLIKSLEHASPEPAEKCLIVNNKDPYMRIEMLYPRLEEIIPETPVRANLVHAYPPYTRANIIMVLDTSPHYDLYGLEYRGATVITSTKRTILEGYGVIQLVESSISKQVDAVEVIVDDILGFETIYPILPRDSHSRGIRLCSKQLGLSEEKLSYEHGNPAFIINYASYLRGKAGSLAKLQLQAGLIRLYSLLPLSRSQVVEIAKHLSEAGRVDPIIKRENLLVRKVPIAGLPLRLRKTQNNSKIVLETVLTDSLDIRGWEEASIFCRECWEPLSLYELRGKG